MAVRNKKTPLFTGVNSVFALARTEKSRLVSLVGASSNTLYGVISDVDAKLAECGLIMVGKKVVDIGNVNHKQHVPYDTKILYSEGKS